VNEAVAFTVDWEQRVRKGETPLSVTSDQVDRYLSRTRAKETP
jgi:hypothetical protein